MKAPETQGGRLLKRGDTRDPECHRVTHRLHVALALLAADGVKPIYPKHFDSCARSRLVLGQNRALQPCTCGIGTDPSPEWPEWIDGEVFDAAYRLADLLQTKRGEHGRAEASRAKCAEHLAACAPADVCPVPEDNSPEARRARGLEPIRPTQHRLASARTRAER